MHSYDDGPQTHRPLAEEVLSRFNHHQHQGATFVVAQLSGHRQTCSTELLHQLLHVIIRRRPACQGKQPIIAHSRGHPSPSIARGASTSKLGRNGRLTKLFVVFFTKPCFCGFGGLSLVFTVAHTDTEKTFYWCHSM